VKLPGAHTDFCQSFSTPVTPGDTGAGSGSACATLTGSRAMAAPARASWDSGARRREGVMIKVLVRDGKFRQLFEMLGSSADATQFVAVLPATGRVLLTIFAMQWSRSKP
jgi:hypothetical protein